MSWGIRGNDMPWELQYVFHRFENYVEGMFDGITTPVSPGQIHTFNSNLRHILTPQVFWNLIRPHLFCVMANMIPYPQPGKVMNKCLVAIFRGYLSSLRAVPDDVSSIAVQPEHLFFSSLTKHQFVGWFYWRLKAMGLITNAFATVLPHIHEGVLTVLGRFTPPSSQRNCSICLEQIIVNPEDPLSVIRLPCGHMLHLGCYMDLRINMGNDLRCPLCRRNIFFNTC